MKKNIVKPALLAFIVASMTLSSCEKDSGTPIVDEEEQIDDSNAFNEDRWITLTTALSSGSNNAPPTTDNGNGGTYAYAIKHAQAIDPNYVLDIYPEGQGFHLKSQRTARVQASADGQFLYNIQYTGDDGGIFNKYRVNGEGDFDEVGHEVNTALILGTSPRWVKAAEGIGVGVYTDGNVSINTGTKENPVFGGNVTTVRAAIIDLVNPGMTNTNEIKAQFDEEWALKGYTLGRTDVPVLNEAKTKVFIGGSISKVDPTKPTLNADGTVTWNTPDEAERELGTATLVVDYPSLRNPHFIISKNSTSNNNSYRTMSQFVGSDGHIYQATATSGSQILRIDKNTNKYDDGYNFDLNEALNVSGTSIRSWLYLEDGQALIMYHQEGVDGGFLALADINEKTAEKLATDVQSDPNLNFGQYQHIARNGDFVYIPLTPHSKDGNLYVINWKTGEVVKGAKLKGYAFARYIGSY